jgi:hypothetical protein
MLGKIGKIQMLPQLDGPVGTRLSQLPSLSGSRSVRRPEGDTLLR